MKIPVNILNKISYIYLAIPLVIFLFFWLKPVYAVTLLIFLFAILYLLFNQKRNDTLIIRKSFVYICFLYSIFLCTISGIGGLFYQNYPDWNIKNAIFHDLINFSWPVIYDNGTALTYYFAFLLPSSLVGKLATLINLSEEMSFCIANIFLLIWSAIGLFLILLFLLKLIKIKKFSNLLLLLLIVFLFSGMDIINPSSQDLSIIAHIERHGRFNYCSNFTLLQFAFNQAIPSWLIVCLFINNLRNFLKNGCLLMFHLFYSPMPFLGLLFYFVTLFLYKIFTNIKNSYKLKKILVSVCDFKNILSISIMIILYLYYKSNFVARYSDFVFVNISFQMFWFIFTEVLLYILILSRKYIRNLLFIITSVFLIICPMFSMTTNNDLCMRASIPALFMLTIFCIKFMLKYHGNNIWKIVLCILLFLGSITPILSLSRSFYYMYINKNIQLPVKDEVKTLNNKITIFSIWIDGIGDYKLYGCFYPSQTLFGKYLARRNSNY